MRWDRLLAEIEASALDEAALERDALAVELTDEEWSGARIRDLVWGDVALDVRGVGWVEGRVLRSTEEFMVLAEAAREIVVARAALLGWRGGSGRAPEPRGVEARLGWAQLLRALRDEGEPVCVVRTDGVAVTGVVGAVTREAVRLEGSGKENPGSPVWVVLTAVATLHVL